MDAQAPFRPPRGEESKDRREERHRRHRPHRKSAEIAGHVLPPGKRQAGKDREEVRCPRQTMKRAHPERGVSMGMCPRRVVGFAGSVDMEMEVTLATMPVGMGMKPVVEEASKTPQSQENERRARHPLAPAGQPLQVDRLAKSEGKERDEEHARRMAQTPPQPHSPGAVARRDRKWSEGCEMVQTGEDMDRPRDQARERHGNHDSPVRSNRQDAEDAKKTDSGKISKALPGALGDLAVNTDDSIIVARSTIVATHAPRATLIWTARPGGFGYTGSREPGGLGMEPRLKKISVGSSSESSQIDSRKRYRVKIEEQWYEGSFSKQWFGWRFDGYGTTGLQLNLIDAVYEIVPPDRKDKRKK